jgi:acyl-coenzyme A thioesterase PaaI-like protein
MKPRTPDLCGKVREIFHRAAFIEDLGIRLKGLGEGWCESVLEVAPKHRQQDGYVHAGVQAAMADHTAGGAA